MTNKPTFEEAELLDKHRGEARAAATAAAQAFANLAHESHDEWFVTFVAELDRIDRGSLENGYPPVYIPALSGLKTVLGMYGVK